MLEATCRMLLDRYGVVFRELLARESILPKWRELLITFRRLEDRGEVRGGDSSTASTASNSLCPKLSIRCARCAMSALTTRTADITISAADPFNLVGIHHSR